MKIINSLIVYTFLATSTLLNIYIFFQRCPNEKKFQNLDGNDRFRKIIFITPTYFRPVQQAEVTRLAHTLLLVPNIHWIIVEDSPTKTSYLIKFLRKISSKKIYDYFNYTHLNVETPQSFKTSQNEPNWLKPRGVWQRNEALKWLRENASNEFHDGVVYFGDDDNTYDLKLFDEIRTTRKVSVFPVGLVGGLLVEKPVVKNNKVVSFNSIWKPKRKYPIDMSGFAINLQLIQEKKDAYFSPYVPRGLQETHLLSQLIQSIDELEPKADSCTKILVWHTRTENPKLKKTNNNG